jgi:hypothetical protein
MGIGFGAAYPDFKAENPAQTATSFGGLVFMIMCAGCIGLVIFKVSSEILPFDGYARFWSNRIFVLCEGKIRAAGHPQPFANEHDLTNTTVDDNF